MKLIQNLLIAKDVYNKNIPKTFTDNYNYYDRFYDYQIEKVLELKNNNINLANSYLEDIFYQNVLSLTDKVPLSVLKGNDYVLNKGIDLCKKTKFIL